MSTVAKLWLCSDLTDIDRSARQAALGDFLFNQTTGELLITGATGPITLAAGASGLPAATATVAGAVKEAAAVTALTDSTGGTASATLAAITAGASYAQADMVAAKNAIASLNTQINALIASMAAAGQIV